METVRLNLSQGKSQLSFLLIRYVCYWSLFYAFLRALFEGEFKNGCKEGHGKMTYPSGNYYEGDWKSDQKEG